MIHDSGTRRHLGSLGLSALLLLGCDQPDPRAFDPGTIAVTVDTLQADSRGVRTLEVTNRGYDPDAGPAFRLVERMRVGSLEGSDDSLAGPKR